MISSLKNIPKEVILYGVLSVLLGMYGPGLQTAMPENIKNLFDCNLFRFAVMILIIYLSKINLQLSIIVTLGLMIGMSVSNSKIDIERFESKGKESFNDFKKIAEFYEETFENTDNRENDSDEPISENDSTMNDVPGPVTEKTEGFNNINTVPSIENFFDKPSYSGDSNKNFWNNIERFENETEEVDRKTEKFSYSSMPSNNLAEYEDHLKQTVENYTF